MYDLPYGSKKVYDLEYEFEYEEVVNIDDSKFCTICIGICLPIMNICRKRIKRLVFIFVSLYLIFVVLMIWLYQSKDIKPKVYNDSLSKGIVQTQKEETTTPNTTMNKLQRQRDRAQEIADRLHKSIELSRKVQDLSSQIQEQMAKANGKDGVEKLAAMEKLQDLLRQQRELVGLGKKRLQEQRQANKDRDAETNKPVGAGIRGRRDLRDLLKNG